MSGFINENDAYDELDLRGLEEEVISKIRLKKAYLGLRRRQQVILGLTINGFTQQDIANILKVSRTTIGTIKKRAIAILRHSLDIDNCS